MSIEHAFGWSQLHASTRAVSDDQRTIFNGIGNWYVSKTRAVENFELSLWRWKRFHPFRGKPSYRLWSSAASGAACNLVRFGSVRFVRTTQRVVEFQFRRKPFSRGGPCNFAVMTLACYSSENNSHSMLFRSSCFWCIVVAVCASNFEARIPTYLQRPVI